MYNFPSIGQSTDYTPRQQATHWLNAARDAEARARDAATWCDAAQEAYWLDRAIYYHLGAADAFGALPDAVDNVYQSGWHRRQAELHKKRIAKLVKPTA